MNMLKSILVLAAVAASTTAFAQANRVAPKDFHGAVADQDSYKVIYQLNSDDDKVIKGTLRNIMNSLDDPRLKGKLEVELVAHSGGVAVFMKSNPYEAQLKALQDRGVILAECENTMRERKIERSELFDFISYVPSGNGELIIRQQQGWAVIHP